VLRLLVEEDHELFFPGVMFLLLLVELFLEVFSVLLQRIRMLFFLLVHIILVLNFLRVNFILVVTEDLNDLCRLLKDLRVLL